jgi:hypothetical protein
VNIIWVNMLINISRVIFGRVVTQVLLTGLIIESKESLSFTIKEPEISHFHCALLLLFDGNINNAHSCGVVNVDESWWLWMTKFFKDKAYDFGFLSIKEECAKFCLSNGGSYQFENRKCNVDGPVDLNWRTITGNIAREEVANSYAPSSTVFCNNCCKGLFHALLIVERSLSVGSVSAYLYEMAGKVLISVIGNTR